MQWAATTGVVPLSGYAYTAETDDCPTDFASSAVVEFSSVVAVNLSSPNALLAELAHGPLAITIWADSNVNLQLYSSGIYSPANSSSAKEDHAITLIGYGTEVLASGGSVDYWIIKNRCVGALGLMAGGGLEVLRVVCCCAKFFAVPSHQIHPLAAMLPCSWGTGWGESGFLRMKKEPWLDGPNAPSGVYWRGIYSASRPIVGQGEWRWHGCCWKVVPVL